MNRVLLALVCMAVVSSACGDSPVQPTEPLSITGVTPDAGAADEATQVIINGTGFQQGATVSIGGPTTQVVLLSATAIKARTPTRPAGAVLVTVTNPDGRSVTWNRQYTFQPFELASISRSRGIVGDNVTILGTGFHPDAAVTFGGLRAAAGFPSQTASGSRIVIAPAQAPGVVDVTVTQPSGAFRTLSSAFTYEVVSLSVNVTQAIVGGPITVTWNAPPGRSLADWVSLYRVIDANEAYGQWTYTDGRSSGTFTASAPAAGQYEFRYFADDGYTDVARSAPITVTASGQAGVAAAPVVVRRRGGR